MSRLACRPRARARLGALLGADRIARPSKAEGPAREHVLAWAAARSLEARRRRGQRRRARPRVVRSRRRAGGRSPVASRHGLRARSGQPVRPARGTDRRRVDGDWVRAEGTTLGADNGIGVAAAMAVADDPAIEHGPLELLFTVSEEQGLDGAKALDPSLVSGRLLVNLDGTSDDALTVGCAGKRPHAPALPLSELRPAGPRRTPSRALRREGRSLRRRHRGWTGERDQGPRSSSRRGHRGGAVPSRRRSTEASAATRSRATPARHSWSFRPRRRARLRSSAEAGLATIVREVHRHRRRPRARARTCVATERSLRRGGENLASSTSSRRSRPASLAMTPGSRSRPDEHQSHRRGHADGMLTLASMTRSSNALALEDVACDDRSPPRPACRGRDRDRRSYPPWEPRPRLSSFSRPRQATHSRLFDSEPALTVVHGGLECAVIGQKLPGAEMISIGPEIVSLHAPASA